MFAIYFRLLFGLIKLSEDLALWNFIDKLIKAIISRLNCLWKLWFVAALGEITSVYEGRRVSLSNSQSNKAQKLKHL